MQVAAADAARLLLRRDFGVELSVWTVGRYLQQWGLTPQKPMTRASERHPVAVHRWLELDYPTLRADARRIGGEIHWGDAMGVSV